MTHAFMKGGAFIIVAALAYVALGENISDYKGLAKRAPFIAFGHDHPAVLPGRHTAAVRVREQVRAVLRSDGGLPDSRARTG